MRSDHGHERLNEAQAGGDASEEGVWVLFQGDLRPGESQVGEDEEECGQGEKPSQDHQQSEDGQSKLGSVFLCRTMSTIKYNEVVEQRFSGKNCRLWSFKLRLSAISRRSMPGLFSYTL